MIDFEGKGHEFRAGDDGLCNRYVVTEFREAPFEAKTREGGTRWVTDDMSTYAICRQPAEEHHD